MNEFDELTAAAPTTTPASLTSAPEEITGRVTRLHAKQSPTWSAGKMTVKFRDVSFTVKGFVKLNEAVTLRGKWTTHAKFGRQFEATEVVYTLPTTPEGVKLWLENYAPDVGPVKAQRIVDEFGAAVLELASTSPEQIAVFARIPIESVHRIAEQWATFAERIACVGELARLGLTPLQSELVYSRFKGSAVTILKTDPYLLLREIDGFGWKTVDDLARKLGFPKDHPGRQRAAVVTAVAGRVGNGSTAMDDDAAIGKACDLCEMPPGEFGAVFGERAADAAELKQLKRVATGTGHALALPATYQYESLVWKKLAAGCGRNPHVPSHDADKLAALYGEITAKGVTVVLDETQREAVRIVASSRISFIVGGAGSGKTLTARCIDKMFRDMGLEVYLCAPTGKAARRMQDVIGHEATTIHRLLGYSPNGGFGYDDRNQLPCGVLIVDESSMLGAELSYHLLRACGSNISIVFIGDPNQLAPVDAGAMLRDVIAHDLAPVARLGVCHRQAGDLKRNSNAILEGRVEPTVRTEDGAYPWYVKDDLRTPEKVLEGIRQLFTKYLDDWGYNPSRDVQFLTAQHAGPLGTTFLNRYCQWMHQAKLGETIPEPKPTDDGKAILMVGDKVMQTKNDYDLGVMNGEQGVVIETRPNLVVRFDEKTVDFAGAKSNTVQLSYVITPHKAQGSEYPCAVVVVPKQHSFMMSRKWLYTAVTRAKKTAIVLGDRESIQRAANKDESDTRRTLLEVFALHPESRPN